MVLPLKYLGRVLLAADDDWATVVQNLAKVQTVWQRMSRILSSHGGRLQVYGFFFKAVAQLVFFFGADMWVVTPRMGRVPGGFQYQVARRLTGRIPRRRLDRNLDYTSTEAAIAAAGFEPM